MVKSIGEKADPKIELSSEGNYKGRVTPNFIMEVYRYAQIDTTKTNLQVFMFLLLTDATRHPADERYDQVS